MTLSKTLGLVIKTKSSSLPILVLGFFVICSSYTDLYAQKTKPRKKVNVINRDSTGNDSNRISYERNIHEVVVTSQRKEANITDTRMGVQKLTGSEIQKVPALLGEIDVVKAIQLLPGVQSTSEGSSGFNVRGGGADQNLILLDNTNIYNASHMFGFFSVFNNDAVKSAELYKGNMPIKYGGRLSSLLDVELKDDAPEKVKGTGGIGLISSRLTLEGPLGDKTSWLVSGRRSYADLFLRMSSDPEKKKEYLYFYDFNAKVSHRLSMTDKVGLNIY
ncbi:MAG: TonB-dependent receptor plug domain-containing protein, partial [Prevotella sp.]